MEAKRLDWLEYWYKIFFRCRIRHCTGNMKCYIFANYDDLKEYCQKNNIKYEKHIYNDYVLVNENCIGNVVGLRIKEVHIISSNVYDLVKELCEQAIKDGYDLKIYEGR